MTVVVDRADERAYALGRLPFELACAAEDEDDPDDPDDPEDPEDDDDPEDPEDDDPEGAAAGRPALLALSSGGDVEAEVGSGATSIPIRRMLW